MKIHNLQQGSPEWLAHRRAHFNASDAPAMMGCSPYKTRTQLLHEMHTGFVPEVDAATQRRFDDGHRFEALARPLAEDIIDEDLFPVTGSKGRHSASFDGLTMDKRIDYESKTLNDALRVAMVEGCTGTDLPMVYQVQMEQQLMVVSAEKCLFMASKWDGDTLVEERHCWYYPNLELRAKIGAGWNQFEIDLAAYVPAEAAQVVVATPVDSLPAVSVQLRGYLVVASNLPEFGVDLRAFIERMPAQPENDQQFADAESACKALKKAEEALDSAETHALAQMSDVESMRRVVADLKHLARTTRLAQEKNVASRKEQIRADIVKGAGQKFAEHMNSLNQRIGKAYMPHVATDFAGVIKGKRTIDSLREAVTNELTRAKIEANAIADRISLNMATLHDLAASHAFLFSDASHIVLKQPDDLTLLVKSRITEHKAAEEKRLEEQREQIRQEELARIEREAAEVERIKAKELAQAEAIKQLQQQEAAERQRVAAIPQATQHEASNDAPNPVQSEAEAVRNIAPVANVIPIARPALLPASTPPTLKLGDIGTRLGFSLTADFLRSLGFEVAAKERGACLFHEASFPLMLAALVRHLESVQAKQAA